MEARIIRVEPAAYGWTLRSGINETQYQFQTMAAAIAAGWSLARRQNAELHISQHDGGVRLHAPLDSKQDIPGE